MGGVFGASIVVCGLADVLFKSLLLAGWGFVGGFFSGWLVPTENAAHKMRLSIMLFRFA